MRVPFLLILFLVTCKEISSQESFLPQMNGSTSSGRGDSFEITSRRSDVSNGGLISSGPESVTEVTPHDNIFDNILSRGRYFISSATNYFRYALSSYTRRIFGDVRTVWSTGVKTVRGLLSGSITYGDIASDVRSRVSDVTHWFSKKLLLFYDDLSFVLAPIRSIFVDGSEFGEIRRAISHASSNNTINLLALQRYIASEIAGGKNVSAASRNLLTALSGGGTLESNIVKRAIYSTPGADSGYIDIPDFRHSIVTQIAKERDESARILEPYRLAVADDYSQASYFIRRAVDLPLAIAEQIWHLLEMTVSDSRTFLMTLGPIGMVTGLGLNVTLHVLSLFASPISKVISVVIRSGASLVGGIIRTVLRPFRSVINLALKLVTYPISLVWRVVSFLVGFIRSLLGRGVSIILTPFRWIFDLGKDVVSGIIRLVLYPIRLVSHGVFDLFRIVVVFPISLITRLLRSIGSIFGIH